MSSTIFHRIVVSAALGLVSAGVVHAMEHPRLFFSQKDIPSLRQQAATTHTEIWLPIQAYADSLLSTTPPPCPCPAVGRPGLDPFANGGNLLIPLSFAYVISGDPRYADKTKEYLLAYAGWSEWGDEGACGQRDLGLSHMLMGNALAFDWVHDRLSEGERATIRNALGLHAGQQYEASSSSTSNSVWNNWWRSNYMQNHWSTNNSALGLAALALEGEVPHADHWLQFASQEMGIDSAILAGVADGTWHEGNHYQAYKLTLSLPFLRCYRLLKGIDIIPGEYFRNFGLWRGYQALAESPRFLFEIGDMNQKWGFNTYDVQGILRFVASEYRDGNAEWVARHIAQFNGRPANVYHAPWSVFEFLYFDPSVVPQSPELLPKSRFFPDLQAVVWRTGWGASDLVFGLKCGPLGGVSSFNRYLSKSAPFGKPSTVFHAGHDHFDAGTFTMFRGRTELAGEYSHYQGADDYTALHNTLLVDGAGQYRQRWPELWPFPDTGGSIKTVFNLPDYSHLAADLTNAYREKNSDQFQTPGPWRMQSYQRQVLFVRPDYFVMIDDIRSTLPHTYEWICHFSKDSTVSFEGDWIMGQSSEASALGIKVLAPSGFSTTTGFSSHPASSNIKKPWVRVASPSGSTDMRFVTVLFPIQNTDWASRPSMSLLGQNENGAAVRVQQNGYHDHVIGRGAGSAVSTGGYVLSGSAGGAAWNADGALERLYILGGRSLSDLEGARVLVSTSNTQSLQAVFAGRGLALHGEGLRNVRVYAPETSADLVTVNGVSASATKSGNEIVVEGSDQDPPPAPPLRLRVR